MHKFLIFVISLIFVGCQTFAPPRDDQGNLISHPVPEIYRPLEDIRIRPTVVRNFGSDTAITTVGQHAYVRDLDSWLTRNPVGSGKYHAVLRHEQVHASRQLDYDTTLWISRYAVDREFALLEEQIGYYYEFQERRVRGVQIIPEGYAAALSKYKILTGNLISYEDALAWIHDVLAGRWTPPN